MCTTTLPPTGPDLIAEAAEYAATAARRARVSALRALLMVLWPDTEERRADCLAMARAWCQREYGSAGQLRVLHGIEASGALLRCACHYRAECSTTDDETTGATA